MPHTTCRGTSGNGFRLLYLEHIELCAQGENNIHLKIRSRKLDLDDAGMEEEEEEE
jgi:hypothetical protein